MCVLFIIGPLFTVLVVEVGYLIYMLSYTEGLYAQGGLFLMILVGSALTLWSGAVIVVGIYRMAEDWKRQQLKAKFKRMIDG